MKEILIKFLVFCGIASIGGFIDVFLKYQGIDATVTIYTIVGYWSCYIIRDL